MRYLQAYSFVFGSRNWAMNLLLASLCVLIPVVGPIILIGYLFEVIDALLGRRLRPRDRKSAENASDAISVQPRVTPATVSPAHAGDYPDLTFDRLGEYLTRGIWPFLVQFIVNLPVGVVFAMLWMLGVVLMGVATANDWDVAVPIIVVILFLVYLLAIVALGVVSAPLYLRAGLSGDFASAFSMSFVSDFLRRVGKETLLMQLFLSATSLGMALLGMLACCVGIYPAMALVIFAHHHLAWQLYELYLERGGTPVELKEAWAIRAAPEEDW